jgi:hypothetical protein
MCCLNYYKQAKKQTGDAEAVIGIFIWVATGRSYGLGYDIATTSEGPLFCIETVAKAGKW